MLALLVPLVGCSEFTLNPKDADLPEGADDSAGPDETDTRVDSAGDTAPDSGLVVDTGDDCDTGAAATGTWELGAVEPDPDTVATCRDLGGAVDYAFVREWEVPHASFFMQAVVAPDNGEPFATVYLDDMGDQQMWTLDGRDGSTRARLPLGRWDDDGSTPFVGDLDGDGAVEFVRTSWSDIQWVDGATRVVSSLFNPYSGGGTQDEVLSLVDIDLDGDFEVVLPLATFDLDGTLRAQTTDALESTGAFAMDLDLDGLPELVNGAGIWSPLDGSGVAWDAAATPDYAFYGAPVDAGGVADIVFNTGRRAVNRGNLDGTLDFTQDGPGARALVSMADATGDGVADLCTVDARGLGRDVLVLLDIDGVARQEWSFGPYTLQSGGCSMADLDADGVYEVVLVGYDGLWILDGVSGAILASDPTIHTDARDSAPVIADLDGDGSAEILVVTREAVIALGPATGRWARTRPVWNQLSYDVTSIRDDGSLVSAPVPVWSTYGIFRAQPSHDGAHPDLVVTATAEPFCDTMLLRVEVSNPGATEAPAGALLRLLAADGTLAEIATTTLPAIPPGERITAQLSIEPSALGTLWVAEVVPAHADECDWTNNRAEGTP